jgi:hypothetical protein
MVDQTTHQPILTEDEIRQRMSDIMRRVEKERATFRAAYETLTKREARVQLAITFQEPKLFNRQESREYMERALEEKVKLLAPDKEALILIELEPEKIAYDLAKFDCETSDKDYAKLEKQLSFYQSLMKL